MGALRTRSGVAIVAAIVLSAVLATAAGAKLAASWQLVVNHEAACSSLNDTTGTSGTWIGGRRYPIVVDGQTLRITRPKPSRCAD